MKLPDIVKKVCYILLVAFFLVAAVACSEKDEPVIEDEEETPVMPIGDYKYIEISRAEQNYVDAQNDFSLKVYRELSKLRSTDQPNLVLSPLSTSMLLGILATGAEGTTRHEIIETLGFDNADIDLVNSFNARLANELTSVSTESVCDIANAAWFDNSLKVNDKFIKTCKENYNLELNQIDLHTEATRRTMNEWVALHTNNLISEPFKVLPDKEINSVLCNTIYFKGLWSFPFTKANTKSGVFYNNDGTESTVQFMHSGYLGMGSEHEDYIAVCLPFGEGNFCMGFILPDPRTDLQSVMEKFDGKQLIDELLNGKEAYAIDLALPKFEIENSHTNLSKVLFELGINEAFTPGLADFRNLTSMPYYIHGLQQDMHIVVDEDGVEAAALTREHGATGAHKPMNARFNVPFAFFIFESSTGAIIYVGDVTKL